MSIESGFLYSTDSLFDVDENGHFTDFQPLSTSITGFFRILVGKHSGRKVVVKTLKEDYIDNPIAVAQLKKEFSTLFSIDSPYVAQAFKLVTLKNGAPAIEMGWCGGCNIRALMSNNLSAEDASEIVRSVLRGLRDIHLAGIIHRDIKPENVMYDPLRKVVKIIDFGCAYVTGALVLQGPNGTVGYTPGHKEGIGAEPEPKDDLYALGVMTAELTESLAVQSKKGRHFKKKLAQFSDNLIEGSYQTAEQAAEAFERIIKMSKSRWRIIAEAATFILTGTSVFFIWHFKESQSQQEQIETTTDSYSTTSSAITVEINESEPTQAADISRTYMSSSSPRLPESASYPGNSVKQESAAERPYLNPYSNVSEEDEAAYQYAIEAGPLLQSAKSQEAPLHDKMDAFVVNYCDSVYFGDNMQFTLPNHLEVDERRELAKQLAESHLYEMEQAFNRQFGKGGNAHRRAVMLEGRFYCLLYSYNSIP